MLCRLSGSIWRGVSAMAPPGTLQTMPSMARNGSCWLRDTTVSKGVIQCMHGASWAGRYPGGPSTTPHLSAANQCTAQCRESARRP